VLGLDRQRVALDLRPGMIGGAQPDHLGAEPRRTWIDVATAVLDHDTHSRFLPGDAGNRDGVAAQAWPGLRLGGVLCGVFCGAGVVAHSRIAWAPGRSMCTLSSTAVTQVSGM